MTQTETMTAKSANQDPRQAMGSDALAEANRRASPQLSVASGFTPAMGAGICGIALLGLMTFSSLAAQRGNTQQAGRSVAANAVPGAANGANGQGIIPVRGPDQPPVLLKPKMPCSPA
jgi:hypothetical protein